MKYAFYKIGIVSKLERKLFFEAYYFSFITRITLMILSFSKYSRRLGEKGKYSLSDQNVDSKLLKEILHAVRRSVKYSLWRNKCLEQAITAKKMLAKRKISSTIYFGVRKPEEKLEAHAWLKVGNTFVVGEKQHETFTIVAFYT